MSVMSEKFCPECQAAGKKSIITCHGGSATAMYAPPFYDKEGRYHQHDPNTYTQNYTCSEGHEWAESSRPKCWCEGAPK